MTNKPVYCQGKKKRKEKALNYDTNTLSRMY